MKTRVAGMLLFLAMPLWLFAGGQAGSIQGTVSDSGGKPVAGALATVVAGSLDRMVFTDNRGTFAFENLPAGEYSVQITSPRFAASRKDKIQVASGPASGLKFRLQTVAEVLRRASVQGTRPGNDIVWTLRSSRGTQSVLRFTDSDTPGFDGLLSDYSGFLQVYSKTDPGARYRSNRMGSRFSVTMGLPSDAKVTLWGQYNESPLDPKGASALYEFNSAPGHRTQLGVSVRQGIVLDDVFSSEELKEFQARYADRFHLTDDLVIEHGAELGHAEGLASTSYLRPKLSVSWVPNDRTVIGMAVTTQAPGNSDDPVRGRDDFERVALPPALERFFHAEIGASQFLDAKTKVSITGFLDHANHRALFVSAPDGRRGLLILDGRTTPSEGLRFNVSREFDAFDAGIGYTVANAAALAPGTTEVDQIRQQVSRRRFHVFTARVKTQIEWTNTELTAVYRWISRYTVGSIDPYQSVTEFGDPTLGLSVAQNLPTFGTIPAKVQATFDARNLFEQPFGSSKTELAHSPRFVKGGINIRF